MDRRTKEAVRYLGYGQHAVDEPTLILIAESLKELERAAGERLVYRIFECRSEDENSVQIEELQIESKSLKQNLKGCDRVILLTATLGAEVDRILKRYAITNVAKAVVVQACAAAMLEEYLDGWQDEMRKKYAKEGCYLRPRFSPGYGDFTIVCQEQILRMLEAPKKIGVTVTKSMMLAPTKSVTAIVGIGKEDIRCRSIACEECDKTDCLYRRE